MGTLSNIIAFVSTVSFLTFVALFGRLPALRNTPIGFLHRLIWNHLPRFLRNLDHNVSGGRITTYASSLANYLWNENHPLILIFFLLLMIVSQALFLPPAWPALTNSERLPISLLVFLPYCLLYLSVTSTASIISASNHRQHMRLYPYDHVLYRPNNSCSTCLFPKPARSKHCRVCKVCVSKHDHHCVWINNCVGRANYAFFLSLLFSVSVMLTYGSYLAYSILSRLLQSSLAQPPSSAHWSTGLSWTEYLNLWALAIVQSVRIGGVGLLAILCAPLAWGLTIYHVYLIWAGMTTNETTKWADWRDDIADGVVWKAKRSEVRGIIGRTHYGSEDSGKEENEPYVDWPVECDQLLVRTVDGEEPRFGTRRQRLEIDGEEEEPLWSRVRDLSEIENLYDLGFWGNLLDIMHFKRP